MEDSYFSAGRKVEFTFVNEVSRVFFMDNIRFKDHFRTHMVNTTCKGGNIQVLISIVFKLLALSKYTSNFRVVVNI